VIPAHYRGLALHDPIVSEWIQSASLVSALTAFPALEARRAAADRVCREFILIAYSVTYSVIRPERGSGDCIRTRCSCFVIATQAYTGLQKDLGLYVARTVCA
jgi:hypothetical protein